MTKNQLIAVLALLLGSAIGISVLLDEARTTLMVWMPGESRPDAWCEGLPLERCGEFSQHCREAAYCDGIRFCAEWSARMRVPKQAPFRARRPAAPGCFLAAAACRRMGRVTRSSGRRPGPSAAAVATVYVTRRSPAAIAPRTATLLGGRAALPPGEAPLRASRGR